MNEWVTSAFQSCFQTSPYHKRQQQIDAYMATASCFERRIIILCCATIYPFPPATGKANFEFHDRAMFKSYVLFDLIS